ncbi:MAG: hypothetical protein ACI9FJ_001608 [Alteromonadaceae bacterium]|jgi:hypothetical protein
MTKNNTIRQAYQALLASFEAQSITSMLLTTFNFSAGFFEQNLLPLIGDNDAATAVHLSTAQINETLSKTCVTVVCDRTTNPEPKGNYRYGLLAVGLQEAYFHPKIMLATGTLMGGKPGAMLMVASCNLSLSGWGLNREVVGCCQVTMKQHQALIPLLEWIKTAADEQMNLLNLSTDDKLKEEGDIRNNLTNMLAFIQAHCTDPLPNQPHFYARIPVKRKQNPSDKPDDKAIQGSFLSTLIEPLVTDHAKPFKHCQLVSPFWSQSLYLAPLFKQLNTEQLLIVPSINNQRAYQLPVSVREYLTKAKINHNYQHFSQNDRYTHAKSIRLTDAKHVHYLIGSANFTYAAMGSLKQGNIEAMLSYSIPVSQSAKQPMQTFALDDVQWADENELPEHAPLIPPFIAIGSYDWRLQTFKCVVQCSPEVFGDLTLVSFGQQKRPTQHFTKRPNDLYCAEIKIGLGQPVYHFTLYYRTAPSDKNEPEQRHTYQGLVTQCNGEYDQLGYSPKPDLGTILAQLSRLDLQKNPGRGGGFSTETASSTDEALAQSSQVFDFFSMFQAIYKVRDFFAQHPKLNPFASSAANSLAVIFRAVILEEPAGDSQDQQLIKHFILLSELQVAASSLAAQHPGNESKDLLAALAAHLTQLTPQFKKLIARSVMLKQFIHYEGETKGENKGIGIDDDAVERVYRWFKTQLSDYYE